MKHPASLTGRILSVIFIFSLVGCGSGSSSNDNPAPVTPVTATANAGVDQTVDEGATVTLDASASGDSDGGALTYTWVQTAGPTVSLSDTAAKQPTFTAPGVAGGTSLTFELTVVDGLASATDSVTVTVNDITAPTWNTATDVGVSDDIVFEFDESIDTASLSLSGDLAAQVTTQKWSKTTTDNDTLTLTPSADGWDSGRRNLALAVKDTSGNAASNTTKFAVRLKLDDFQAAAVEIGQMDFTGGSANQGGTTAADTLKSPAGDLMVIDGRLWLADTYNNRVLGYDGIPTTNGAGASYVIGQSTFTDNGSGASASTLNAPIDVGYDGTYFYVSDEGNSRVLIYDGVPLGAPGTASHVIGQADFGGSGTGCSDTTLKYPDAILAVGGKLILSDWNNSRVLTWNSASAGTANVPPDLVIGQGDFTHCTYNDDNQDGSHESQPTARTLSYQNGIWSDGTRMIVVDTMNNRVLVWNTFPTSSFQGADVVIGQGDFTHQSSNDDNQAGVPGTATARTLNSPVRVWSNGLQLVVTDESNNRVLMWNDIPSTNFQPADVVLGQSTFNGHTANDDNQDGTKDAHPSGRTLDLPWGLGVYRNKLLVSDVGNHRVLVFKSN